MNQFSTIIKKPEEIIALREGGRRLANILEKVKAAVVPGTTTKELNRLAESLIFSAGGKPSFKGYRVSGSSTPYPAALCTSVNDEVVHAIPRGRRLKEGDIIGLDIGMIWKGMFTDMAETVAVGRVDAAGKKLLEATKIALDCGIAASRAGATLGDIGFAIQSCITARGFGVVRELVGHGVGYAVHEPPEVPNWGAPRKGMALEEGMVLALEPMATEGAPDVTLCKDGWTWKTKDGSRAAHFEHTIAVYKNGAEILTALKQN